MHTERIEAWECIEETGIHNEYDGSHRFHASDTQTQYGLFEIFHHEGGHMQDPDDEMPLLVRQQCLPLDDWRKPAPSGWYWRDCCDGRDPIGPFPTSRDALENADVWNPAFDPDYDTINQ